MMPLRYEALETIQAFDRYLEAKSERGKVLILYTLFPTDLLRTKLYALCDRGTDRQDCIALKPTLDQIKECATWVEARDQNPDWVKHVQSTLKSLVKELGYEF